MKVATLYRKAGKVILETDNDALAQVATDAPQDVVVMDAYERMAARYLADARQAGRPPTLAAPYGQNVPPQGIAAPIIPEDMARIDEVRERLERALLAGMDPMFVGDVDRLLDDHARLREIVAATMHDDHGRGSAEDGPADCDCPCRGTARQSECASHGCGFCLAAATVHDDDTLALIDGPAAPTPAVTDEAVRRLVRAMENTPGDDLLEPSIKLCRRLLIEALRPTKGEEE